MSLTHLLARVLLLAPAIFTLPPTMARADPFPTADFSFTFDNASSPAFEFSVDENPANFIVINPGLFRTTQTITSLIGSQEIEGTVAFSQGGFELNSNDDGVYGAHVLFTDLGSYSYFLAGTYSVEGYNSYPMDGLPFGIAPGVLTVTTTPEPSSFLLLGTGLLGLGGALKRRFA